MKLNLLSYISICPEHKKNENINYINEYIFPIFDNQLKLNILKGPFIEPNQKENESIKKYLKKNLQLSFQPNLKYKLSLEGFYSTLLKYSNVFCITKYVGKNKNINQNSIVLHVNSMSKEIKENGQIYSYSRYYAKIYDYYIVTK